MHVAFLCEEYPPFRNGGIGTYTKEVAERLVQMGHEITVIGVYADVDQDTETFENGVRLLRLAPSRLGNFGNRLKVYRRVRRLESERRVDVLESQEYGGFLMFWPRTRFKIIVRLHGSVVYFNDELKEKSALKKLLWRVPEGSTLRRADRIVSVSRYTADRTKTLFGLSRPIDVIYNGVRLPQVRKTDYAACRELKVVFAGSLVGKKGFFKLIHAWRDVIEQVPDARLHIAGKDNWNSFQIVEQVLGEDRNSVLYHGVLEKTDLENLFCRMDVAIFPSFSEAFSLAPMEAMAVGLPVIYTSMSSGPELISPGKNGWLIDAADIGSISDSIIKFYGLSADQRLHIGEEGRRLIFDRFSVERLAQDNEALYLSMLAAPTAEKGSADVE